MSFSETIFLFFLALIVFGPKKLPEIARQAGKLLAELRRASNEFKSQIEQEIAHIEREDAKKALPPLAAPPGSVASGSLTAAVENQPAATLAEAVLKSGDSLVTAETPASEVSGVVPATEAVVPADAAPTEPEGAPSSQESHA